MYPPLGRRDIKRYSAGVVAALKEWHVVCEALGSGRQAIVIRKGGIAEGRDGLRFEHEEFLLMPTFFHQQAERVRPEVEFSAPAPRESGDESPVEIRHAASLVWHRHIKDRACLRRLATYHILTDEEVETRYQQDPAPGVQVALLRVYRLDPPRVIPWQRGFGGCRSWAEVDEDFAGCTRVSVLSDESFDALEQELRAILG